MGKIATAGRGDFIPADIRRKGRSAHHAEVHYQRAQARLLDQLLDEGKLLALGVQGAN